MALKVKDEILSHVTRKGACGYGIKEARNAKSTQDLINLLLTPKGIEHCMESQYPSMSILKQYKQELEANGIYVEGEYTLTNPSIVVAYGGMINVNVDSYNALEIYATNDAKINVSTADHAFVSVQLSHRATCNKVKESGLSKINIYGDYFNK